MATNRFPFAALAAVLLALLVVLGAFALGSVRQPAAATGGEKAGIVVAGTGSVDAVPDQARFDVTVTHKEGTVDAAMNRTDAGVRKVLAVLSRAGVDRKDVQTVNLAVDPAYDYPHGVEVLRGYTATQQLRVTVRRLADAGKVMAAAATAAGNATQIGGLQLTIGDKAALLAQARANAIKDARTRAGQFADAAGRTVGRLVFVQEQQAAMPAPVPLDGRFPINATADAVKSVSISSGQQKVTVKVSVRWSLR